MDAILLYLVGEVALSGKTGSSVSDFDRYLNDFDAREQQKSAALPDTGRNGSGSNASNRTTLRSQLWYWLLRHPDVFLGTSAFCQDQPRSLREVDAETHELLTKCRAEHANGAEALANSNSNSLHCAIPPHSVTLKLFASEEQMWFAATGHGIDHERVPPMDFDCLSVIAAHGEKGILQPDLARLTGQDIRSVPQRTQRLCNAGYIVRRRLVASRARTSFLLLTKFAMRAERDWNEGRGSIDTTSQSLRQSRYPGLEAVLQNGRYGAVIEKIRQALNLLSESQILMWNDIKRQLGIFSDNGQSRQLAESMRILEAAGVVERVRAWANLPVPGARLHRCIRFLKPITDDEILLLLSASGRPTSIGRNNAAGPSAPVVIASESIGAGFTPSRTASSQDIPWTPIRQLSHQFRDVVYEEGNDGVTLPDIRDSLQGSLYSRPLEQQSSRLVDSWQTSQPPYLRHLGILRDTMQFGRTSMFIHYSGHRIISLLKAGQVSTEAGFDRGWLVADSPRDQYGFSIPSPNEFIEHKKARSWSEIAEHRTSSSTEKSKKRRIGTHALGENFQVVFQAKPARGRPPKVSRGQIVQLAVDSLVRDSHETKDHATAQLKEAPNSLIHVNSLSKDLRDSNKHHHSTIGTTPIHPITNHAGVSALMEQDVSIAGGSPRQRLDSQKGSIEVNGTVVLTRSKALPMSTHDGQAEMISRHGSGIFIGGTHELRRGVRGRGPRSKLAIIKISLLKELPWFKAEERSSLKLDSGTADDESPPTPENVAAEDRIHSGGPSMVAMTPTPSTPGTLDVGTSKSLKEVSPVASSTFEAKPRRMSRNPAVKAAGGSIGVLRRSIIMEIMGEAGGMYPKNEIWFPFTTAWMQRYPDIKPDHRTVRSAVDTLVDQGKLITSTFSFQTKHGTLSTKGILSLPEVDRESDAMQELQNKMIATEPRSYLPSHPPISAELRGQNDNVRSISAAPATPEHSFPRIADETVNIWHKPHYAKRLLERAQNDEDKRKSPKQKKQKKQDARTAKATRRASSSRKRKAEHAFEEPPVDSASETANPIIEDPGFGPDTLQFINVSSATMYPPAPGEFEYEMPPRYDEALLNGLAMLREGPYHIPNATASQQLDMDVPLVQQLEMASRGGAAAQNDIHQSSWHSDIVDIISGMQSEPNGLSKFKKGRARKHSLQTALPSARPDTRTPHHNDPRRGSPRTTSHEHFLDQDSQPNPAIPSSKRQRKYAASRARDLELSLFGEASNNQPVKASSQKAKTRDKRPPNAGFSRKIYVAVSLAKILVGGVEQYLDWEVVSKMLNTSESQTTLHQRWNGARQSFKPVSSYMHEAIRDAFLKGYENGDLPTLTFEDILASDWKAILEYIINHLDLKSLEEKDPLLLDNIAETFDVQLSPAEDLAEYFEVSGPKTTEKRTLILHKDSYVLADPLAVRSNLLQNNIRTAKNWVRANMVALEATYDSAAARSTLGLLGGEAVQAALDELISERVLVHKNKGRATPGRPYILAEPYTAQLANQADIERYRQAIKFKKSLDAAFREREWVGLPERASESALCAYHYMVSKGHVIAREHGKLSSELGIMKPQQGTRTIDEQQLICSIEIGPSPTYIEGNPLIPLPMPPKFRQQHGSDEEEFKLFPLWYDINENLVEGMWDAVITAVISRLVLRPCVSIERLRTSFGPCLEIFEIDLALDWIVDAGIGRWVNVKKGKIALGGWWWMFLDDRRDDVSQD